jgi:hypothetical protein
LDFRFWIVEFGGLETNGGRPGFDGSSVEKIFKIPNKFGDVRGRAIAVAKPREASNE